MTIKPLGNQLSKEYDNIQGQPSLLKNVINRLISAVTGLLVNPFQQQSIPFHSFINKLFTEAKSENKIVHLFKGEKSDNNYSLRSNNLTTSILHIKDDQYQFTGRSKKYTISITGQESFHITPNYIWNKLSNKKNKTGDSEPVSPHKYLQGATKTRKLAIDQNGIKVARLVCKDISKKESIEKEFNILKQFINARGIVHAFDLVEASNKRGNWRMSLYEQLFSHGDLHTFINQKTSTPLTTTEICSLTEDLLHGLYTLHEAGIVHCDLKLENILIGLVNGKLNCAICDFDLAKEITMTNPNPIGSFKTISPEKLIAYFRKYYLKQTVQWTGEDEIKGDIWALGVILYTFYNRGYKQPPWFNCIPKDFEFTLCYYFSTFIDNDQLYPPLRKILTDGYPPPTRSGHSFFPEPNQTENPIEHLIWRMCQFKADQRPLMKEVLEIWNRISTDKNVDNSKK